MNAFLTEGLLDVFDRIIIKFRPEIEHAIDWLRDTATPPQNLVFRSSDGAVFTGLVILEKNRAILMLGVRSSSPAVASSFQQPYRSPVNPDPAPSYQRTLHIDQDEDESDWNPRDPFYCPR